MHKSHPKTGADKGIFPYRFREERYLNWSGGIRATDENHQHAKRYFQRMKKEAKGGALPDRFVEEGQGMARKVREGICDILDPKGSLDPSNVVLGNSASMALLPILSTLGRSGKRFWLMADFDAYSPMLHLLSQGVGGKDWDGVRKRLAMHPDEWYLDKITRQNFGPRGPHDRPSNEAIIEAWKAGNPIKTLSSVAKMRARDHVFTITEAFCGDKGLSPALLMDTCSGEGEAYGEILPLGDSLRRLGGLMVLDVSHTFGIYPLDESVVPDIVIGTSSKAIGAEPTIGFAYVAGWIKDILIEDYIGKEAPFSPFTLQFDRALDPRTHKAMLSLPELHSFMKALERCGGEHPAQRFMRISDWRRDFLRAFYAKVPRSEKYIDETPRNVLSPVPTMFGTSAQMLFLRLGADPHKLMDLISDWKEGPGHEEFMLTIDGIARAQASLRSGLEKEGFYVKVFDERYTLGGESMPTVARISFHPHVEPDIEGFVDAFARLVAQGGKSHG